MWACRGYDSVPVFLCHRSSVRYHDLSIIITCPRLHFAYHDLLYTYSTVVPNTFLFVSETGYHVQDMGGFSGLTVGAGSGGDPPRTSSTRPRPLAGPGRVPPSGSDAWAGFGGRLFSAPVFGAWFSWLSCRQSSRSVIRNGRPSWAVIAVRGGGGGCLGCGGPGISRAPQKWPAAAAYTAASNQ